MQTSRKLKVIAQKEQFPLLITQEIFNKIRFLCKQINKVEWSGVLFYKIIGDIKDPANFSMEVKDIFLMDKGKSTYTEYSFNEDVAEFIMDNAMEDPEFMSYRIGHIHSHNTMAVFFSGTDWDELYDNCENHTFYLSLIVNNFEEMIAKLVYRGVANAYQAMDANGDLYTVQYELDEKQVPDEVLFDHDCVITKPVDLIQVPTVFRDRLDFIVKESEERAKAQELKSKSQIPVKPANQPWLHSPAPKGGGPTPFEIASKGSSFDIPVTQSELFHCFVVRFGEKFVEDTLLDALDGVAAIDQDPTTYAQHIIDNFGHYYSRFYGNLENSEKAMDEFILSVEVFNDDLEDYEGRYSFIPTLRSALQQFSDTLQQIADSNIEEDEFNQSFKN